MQRPSRHCATAAADIGIPPNSLLKKGTGSEPNSEIAEENGLRRRACPLFQRAAKGGAYEREGGTMNLTGGAANGVKKGTGSELKGE
jgi:hypothetical protein